jgi:hypothetical protein
MKARRRLVVSRSLALFAALFAGGVALFAALFAVGVALGQAQNDAMNPTFDGLTDWTTYGVVTHTLEYDHAGEDGSLVLGATFGSGATQTATLQGSGSHVLTVWAKADNANCGLMACLGEVCVYAPLGSTDWRKFGLVGQFQAGNQNVRIQWYATGSCTATELYVDDVGLYYTPEQSPTVYTIDDVYTVLDQMRQADETFHTDTGFMLDEIHHDDHEARHLASMVTTTFQLNDGQSYQIATIGTYTDGERAIIACLIALVMFNVFSFMRKELKG